MVGIAVVPVRYGPSAAAALHARVAAAKADDPLAPVTVVVPSNYVGVAARRRLATGEHGAVTAAGRGVAGVTFLTVYRLAELLAAPTLAAAGRRPVSTPVMAAAVRRAVRAAPGVFASVAHHPATEEALVAAYRELADLPAAQADALAHLGGRAHDVVRLLRSARLALAPEWYDESDLMATAAGLAATAPLAGELGTVIVHLPQDLGHGPALLLRAVAERAEVVVLAGTTGHTDADGDVRRSIGRLGADPAPLDALGPEPLPIDIALEITSTADADDEVRAVVRRLVAALGDGVPLDRMAVLYGTPQPYARLLHEHLTAAGVAYNGSAVRPVAERLAGRTLLAALALADEGYRRRDVMALLTDAPVRDTEGRFLPTSAWERRSRDAGVVRRRSDWDTLLGRWADTEAAKADREAAEAEPREWLVDKRRREAEQARGLRAFVIDLADRIDRTAGAMTWAERAAHARELLDRLVGAERRRQRWPEPERRAAEKVEAAIDRLAGLDTVADPPSAEEFRRTLEEELASDLGRVGRLGEGVAVGALGLGLGLDVDLVIIVGLAEGTLPARVSEDTLLPDREREVTGGSLPLAAHRVHADHRRLVAALAAARRQVVLTYPRGDLRRSAERVPSRWLLDLAGQRAGRALWSDDLADAGSGVDHVPSFAGGVRRLSFPVNDQEYGLRALDGERRAGRDAADHPLVAGDPALGGAIEMVRARRSTDFTRFDGNLAGLAVPSPLDQVRGPTRLEVYAACPHRYLFEQILGVGETEDPEEQLEIAPTDKGILVHAVLETFVNEALTAGAVPAPHEPWPPAWRDRLAAIADEQFDAYEARGLVGRPLFWRRDRPQLRRDLDQFLDRDDALRAESGVTPIAAELDFGMRGSADGPVEVALPDGRTMRFAGSADRVDEGADGELLVTDYKTGGTKAFTKLSEDDPDKNGRKLQLPVYGLAARARVGRPTAPVRAQYWFITAKNKFRRIGYDVTDAVLDRFGHVVGTVVDCIEAGVFPARPPTTTWFRECGFCDPDGVGVTGVARAWEAKRSAPELAALLALLEPGDDDRG